MQGEYAENRGAIDTYHLVHVRLVLKFETLWDAAGFETVSRSTSGAMPHSEEKTQYQSVICPNCDRAELVEIARAAPLYTYALNHGGDMYRAGIVHCCTPKI